MKHNIVQTSKEGEQAELAAVAEALVRSPRLAQLLLYVGEKYFSGEREQLTEYNIATEVFGRSKTAFDSGEDAIARVESHRLRKRLKEYYEAEGKDHAIHIALPPGSYAPVFTTRPNETPGRMAAVPPTANGLGTVEPEAASSPEMLESGAQDRQQASSGGNTALPAWRSRSLAGIVAAISIVLAVAIALWLWRASDKKRQGADAAHSAPLAVASPPGAAKLPLRIMAGYAGPSQIDSAGDTWQEDAFFQYGGTWHRAESPISRTSDPLLFKHWRTGDFDYNIPLGPGVYELHLYFVTSEQPADNLSTFTISINGQAILPGFDINSDAMGPDIADERVFRDVSPATDGILHLRFTSERGAPMLNAIEVLQGIPHRQLPIRIMTQAVAYRDHNGDIWHPDSYFMNGRMRSGPHTITGTQDPDLFSAERYGHFTYAIPVDPRDRFTLVLHFAELYFGPQASGQGGEGSRTFRVLCNGETLLDNFDIFKEAGSLHALVKTFRHLKPTAQGKLNMTFEPIQNNATISGIEVLDESN